MERVRSIKTRTDFSQGRRDKNSHEREYSSTSVQRSPLCLVWKTKSLELDTTVNAPCQIYSSLLVDFLAFRTLNTSWKAPGTL